MDINDKVDDGTLPSKSPELKEDESIRCRKGGSTYSKWNAAARRWWRL
jgi:hypothetical protein